MPDVVFTHRFSRESDGSNEQDLRALLSQQDLRTSLSLGFPSRLRSFTRNKPLDRQSFIETTRAPPAISAPLAPPHRM
ncbi:hypothetical protein [Novipirellula caenicola]|uniref:hypothetical protein n=1 Tax=Novipirellula caenicola TaxID=1536901 RepID=UPI0031EE5E3F